LCRFSLLQIGTVELKVLIACGSEEVGRELTRQIAACEGVRIVGWTYTDDETVQATAALLPDLLVFHVPSRGYPQGALFRRLRAAQPQLRTLAVGCEPHEVGAYFLELAPLGLSGCVCRGGEQELREALCVLGHGGSLYLCPRASQAIVEAYRRQSRRWSRERV